MAQLQQPFAFRGGSVYLCKQQSPVVLSEKGTTMAEIIEIKDLTQQSEVDSTDPQYLAWKREKIEAAVRQADAHPDDTVPMNEILKKHGLEN
jgi:hypothetical protein